MKHVAVWMFFLLFFGGYLVAGSESPYFPLNLIAGVIMVGLSLFFIPAMERAADDHESK